MLGEIDFADKATGGHVACPYANSEREMDKILSADKTLTLSVRPHDFLQTLYIVHSTVKPLITSPECIWKAKRILFKTIRLEYQVSRTTNLIIIMKGESSHD